MIKQIKALKQTVSNLLFAKESNRNSDLKLIANIWHEEIGGSEKATMITAKDFLYLLSQGKLSSPESIMRVRRKIQEQNPLLRGASYKQRKEKETEVKQEIHKV